MAKGYQLIQAQTLTGSASSITFSNIPQNFTDLVVKMSVRDDTAANGKDYKIEFNGVTTNYSYRRIYGDSAAAYSDTASTGQSLTIDSASATASTFANCEIYIPNYASANYKSWSADTVSENNASAANSAYVNLYAGLWSNTAAITSIAIKPVSGSPNIVQYSTFYLYGIGGTRATGGTITSDSNFTYHTFTSTSTFTALEKIKNAEVLVLAGGGGGGGGSGGGGGAGGLVYSSQYSLIAGTSYTAIVGSGGAGSTGSANGAAGGDSLFGGITATGGGRGGTETGVGATSTGGSGGSGGGGGAASSAGSATQTTPSNVSAVSYGNNGGAGSGAGPNYGAGGGGSAAAVGTAGLGTTGGTGAIGTNLFTNWHYATSTGVSSNGIYYVAAGGGGGAYLSGTGGAGGVGGGGTGNTNGVAGTAATANTGAGGGGGGTSLSGATRAAGGAGGSGVVIVRYPSN